MDKMQTQGKFARLAVLVITGTLVLSLSTLATAESDTARAIRASAATVPTNIPGIHTYAEPPKGFNPVTATDEELATYGFPPRPDKQANPDHYAVWERAMKAAKIRWNGELKPLPDMAQRTIPTGSSLLPETVQSQTGPLYWPDINGSGVVVQKKQSSWNSKTSFDVIYALMTVPTAELPIANSSCTANDYKTFVFVGIDNPVYAVSDSLYGLVPGLQGGFYGVVPCPTSSGAPFYFAEFGWQYPLSRGFSVNPGDVVFTDVEAFGPTSGEVYIEDITAATGASYSISASGLIGQNAGWLVMRPCCTSSDGLYPLADTTSIFLNGSANAGSATFNPGSQATSTIILHMTDDGGDQTIETVNQGSGGYEGLHSLYFTTTECAWYGGCTP
jgi:peptidase A4-like protein